jgi:hypothetical protein
MNRIILVGNGFDLAHGLKSSYNSFICDLIIQKIEFAITKKLQTSNEEPYKTGYFHEEQLFKLYIPNFNNLEEYLIQLKKIESYVELKNRLNRDNGSFEVFSNIIQEFEHWADFEYSFFECLITTFNKNGDIEKLNSDFKIIRKYLINYINRIQIEIDGTNSIDGNRINDLINIFSHGEIKELLFLSFNYTRTLGYYFNKIQHKINSKILYLHGNVNELNEDDELIFGYDNELDENFQRIISSSNIQYVDFFKSILYSNNTTKRELLNFLSQDSFDVFSFGHSFSSSDFTILREIFSHVNCNRIKVYYHPELKSADYNNKRKLLNAMLRDTKNGFAKLVERNQSESMPILISNYKALD